MELGRKWGDRARKNQVTFEFELPGKLPRVMGLRKQLLSSLDQILDNAFRHSGSGPVRLTASRLGDEIMVTVADSGPGIPRGKLRRIFDHFYRLDPSRSRETGGQGLGLSLAQEIIEQHGGRIEVASKEGKGTVFRVFLPANEEKELIF